MSRLPPVEREQLTAKGQAIWDEVAAARDGVHGPYLILMRLPELAHAMLEMGNYFRKQGVLSGAQRELAVMVAAREMGSRYEWSRHEAIALKEGVPEATIDAVRVMNYRRLNEHELVIVEVVQSLFRTKMVPQRLYDHAIGQLGQDKLVELISLAGFYSAIAFLLVGFEVALPADADDTF